MAFNPAKQVTQRVTSLLTSTRKLRFQSNLTGLSPESSKTYSTITGHRSPRFLSRLPVELGGMQSLMPLHSVTASALLNSMLSSNVGHWCSLSEGHLASISCVQWLPKEDLCHSLNGSLSIGGNHDSLFKEWVDLGKISCIRTHLGHLKSFNGSRQDLLLHCNMDFKYNEHMKLL